MEGDHGQMKTYDTIIFDMDGTLLDTLEDLQGSVNYALEQKQLPLRTREEIRSFVGNGVKKLVELASGYTEESPEFEEVFALFKEHYGVHCNDRTRPYDGILELLAALKDKGFRMAIVSNKYQEGVQELRDRYFGTYLSVAIGEQEGIRKKPAPDTVMEALRQLGSCRERSVYVGDSEVDIETAQNSQMDCVAVAWGFRTREEQEKAGGTVFIEEPMELLDWLEQAEQ